MSEGEIALRNFSKIRSIAQESRKAAILTHRNADPDAICSALALKRLLKTLNPRLSVVIGTPEGVNRFSENILGRFRVATEPNPNLLHVDAVFTVDTNNLQQLGSLADTVGSFEKSVVVIDHHYPHKSIEEFATLKFCDETFPSTCEMIQELYGELRIRPRRQEAVILLAGILHETGHLRLATSKTLLRVADLIKQGARVEDLFRILKLPMDDSERIARLRAAQRLRMLRFGRWVAVLSEVGSHQASAARALIGLGADLAVVGSEDENRLKLSLRSTKEFYERSGIHLGRDLAKPLGDYLNGTGGGHSLAAGVNGSGKLEQVLRRCSELIRDLTRTPHTPKSPGE